MRLVHRPVRIASGLIAAVTLASSAAFLEARRVPQPTLPSLPPFSHFSTDVTMTHTRFYSTRAAAPHLSSATYHIDASLAAGSWKTVMTTLSHSHPTAHGLQGTHVLDQTAVGRLEYDDSGAPPRFFDTHGTEIQSIQSATLGKAMSVAQQQAIARSASTQRPPAPSRHHTIDGSGGVIIPPASGAARLAALARSYGVMSTAPDGRGHFHKDAQGLTSDVYADATLGVPVEINLLRNGVQAAHYSFTYATRPDGSLVRTGTIIESIDAATGDRIVTQMTWDKVTTGN